MQKEIQRLIKEIAKKHNIPHQVVELIYQTQFEVIRDTIREGYLDTPKLIGLGKFPVSIKKLIVKKIDYKKVHGERQKLVRPDNREAYYKNKFPTLPQGGGDECKGEEDQSTLLQQ